MAQTTDTKFRITQTRSGIGGRRNQLETLRTLGLGRIGKTTVRVASPEVRGQISVVAHLVTVEEVSE